MQSDTSTKTEEPTPPPPAATPPLQYESMAPGLLGVLGSILLIIGGFALFISFQLETSIKAEVPYGDGILSGITRTSEVVNLQLLQRQMMVLHCSLATISFGLMFLVAATIVSSIERLSKRRDPNAAS